MRMPSKSRVVIESRAKAKEYLEGGRRASLGGWALPGASLEGVDGRFQGPPNVRKRRDSAV